MYLFCLCVFWEVNPRRSRLCVGTGISLGNSPLDHYLLKEALLALGFLLLFFSAVFLQTLITANFYPKCVNTGNVTSKDFFPGEEEIVL